MLESLNADGTWVSPNILLSFALIRAVRPYAHSSFATLRLDRLAILVCALIALVPVTGKVADYGAGGWLWALFGLCQRIYVDGTSADGSARSPELGPPAHAAAINASLMRLLACYRRGRLVRLAGTSGIFVSTDPFRGLCSRRRRSVRRACVYSSAARAASNRQKP